MGFTYILCSRPGGALYVGAATDLQRRVEQHRAKAVPGHTVRYGIDRLVWFEAHARIEDARRREHSIKRWRRAWKDALVNELNPGWADLADGIPD